MLDVSERDDKWRVFYVRVSVEQAGVKNTIDPGQQATYIEQWRKQFHCFNDMPSKTREGVACLSMCVNGEHINGIGQRVSEKTYWLDSTPEVLKEYD